MSAKGDQRKFLREVQAAGGEIRPGRGSHRLIYVDGKLVASVGHPGTKGRQNDEAATRRALRAAGLHIRSH